MPDDIGCFAHIDLLFVYIKNKSAEPSSGGHYYDEPTSHSQITVTDDRALSYIDHLLIH